MSLYHEAADVLETTLRSSESIKASVFGRKSWKSDPKTLFALSTETAKWSEILSQVIDNSDLLKAERHLSAALALVLLFEFLLSRKGIVLPTSHGLHASIKRHKARLHAEFAKARIQRGFASIIALRQHVDSEAASKVRQSSGVRWIRINTLNTTLSQQLETTFGKHRRVSTLNELWHSQDVAAPKLIYIDEHVPNVVALRSDDATSTSKSYRKGELILQDKASCFPAYLLDPTPTTGDVLDACAAPGNKTTHLASILNERTAADTSPSSLVLACEMDSERTQTLRQMCSKASAQHLIKVYGKQNFLKLNQNSSAFSKVTGLLLDPSCSGSGIIGRDKGTLDVKLPNKSPHSDRKSQGKKRKRETNDANSSYHLDTASIEENPLQFGEHSSTLQARLENLADFQLRIVQHAMSFPAATRIVYSTCSIHATENEFVVIRALASDIAKSRGWRVMLRREQVSGLQRWCVRGDSGACIAAVASHLREEGRKAAQLSRDIAESCIRCVKGGPEGTMGFFLCGFIRDVGESDDTGESPHETKTLGTEGSEEAWEGFSNNSD